jgi:hypothetical protein
LIFLLTRPRREGFIGDVFGLHELSAGATKRVKMEDEMFEKMLLSV